MARSTHNPSKFSFAKEEREFLINNCHWAALPTPQKQWGIGGVPLRDATVPPEEMGTFRSRPSTRVQFNMSPQAVLGRTCGGIKLPSPGIGGGSHVVGPHSSGDNGVLNK
ncbi:unnamed protein product, partial [Iphiclides podalirius]